MLVFVSFCGISDGHTIEDLIFVWKYDNPLSIKKNLELPEFGIAGTGVGDCTRVFSTGIIPIRCSVSLFVVSLPVSFVLCSSPLTEIQRHFQLSSRVSSPLDASSRRSSPPAHRRHLSAIWRQQTNVPPGGSTFLYHKPPPGVVDFYLCSLYKQMVILLMT